MSQNFKKRSKNPSLSEKVNRILHAMLIAILLILGRVWHIGIFQHAERVEESKRPQRRVVIERAERAIIKDRFGIPLAINKTQYNVSLSYARIREVPRYSWQRTAEGKRVKIFRRKNHIQEIVTLLSQALNIEPQKIEDLIHAKASIFGNVPCLVKENILEETYFRLKMLEKEYPAIVAEIVPKRFYPLGPIGSHVVGYMGAMSAHQYQEITQELRLLTESLNRWEEGEEEYLIEGYHSIDEIKNRLKLLEAKAYTINDAVGKAGIEATFDEELRGSRGKKTFLSDIKGNFLRELPGSETPRPGNTLVLTLSAELQNYAQQLLTEYEAEKLRGPLASFMPEGQLWMKGGAIVVIDPNQGDILALASYPNFDPNDFIEGSDAIHRWIEDERYLAEIWDQRRPLQRERFSLAQGEFLVEERWLDWEGYLAMILPSQSKVRSLLEKMTFKEVYHLQTRVEQLLALFFEPEEEVKPSLTAKAFNFVYDSDQDLKMRMVYTLNELERFKLISEAQGAEIAHIKEELSPYLSSLLANEEKLLLIDLSRLAMDPQRIEPSVLKLLGNSTLQQVDQQRVALLELKERIYREAKELYHEKIMPQLREKEFKEHLQEKRQEEKHKKRWSRPFTDYLEQFENQHFKLFWQRYQDNFLEMILSNESSKERESPFQSLSADLIERLKRDESESWRGAYLCLKKNMEGLERPLISSYLHLFRSFEELKRPLLGSYQGLRRHENISLESDLAAAFYPTYGYGYERSQGFRQATTIGSIFKLVPAYTALCQKFEELEKRVKQATDLNPLTIIDDKHRTAKNSWNVGFTLEHQPIPRFYKGGLLPRSDHAGVGKVDLAKALEASSNPYFAMLSGDYIKDPEDLIAAAHLFTFGEKTGVEIMGEISGYVPTDVIYNRTGLYALSIGQHSLVGTPLQVATLLSSLANGGKVFVPKILLEAITERGREEVLPQLKRKISLPSPVRELLMRGMHQVIFGEKGTARQIRTLSEFTQSKSLVIGKTSTAESLERISLDVSTGRAMSKHVWFGAIAFDKEDKEFHQPKLVVIVYLKYGNYGHNAAPLAVKMINRWQEIIQREPG